MAQRVLVLTASPELGSALLAELRAEALQVELVASAHDGFAAMEARSFDLFLVDAVLTDLTGLEVCERLCGDRELHPSPVIYLTRGGDIAPKVRALDLGAVDCITTPFEPAEFRARVRSALRAKRFQDMLAERAQLDALTGLRNRAWFNARLEEASHACLHRDTPYCVVIMDLDRFKEVNDTFGHPFGDKVLQAFGEKASEALRATDALCRYGGEEFGLVHVGRGVAAGHEIARRIHERVAQLEVPHRSQLVPVRVSIGVAGSDLFPRPRHADAGAVLAAADSALYEAKRGGRNRIVIATAEAVARTA